MTLRFLVPNEKTTPICVVTEYARGMARGRFTADYVQTLPHSAGVRDGARGSQREEGGAAYQEESYHRSQSAHSRQGLAQLFAC